ncbi:hypothetical protein C8R42DRAFT_709424 [Lentinula raphanica]|nr:hypothetical protein C8R42DRAFT_709424 [Lentinula raphanica]
MRLLVANSYILFGLFVVGGARPTGPANSIPANLVHSSANSVLPSAELSPSSPSPAPPANPAALVPASPYVRRTVHAEDIGRKVTVPSPKDVLSSADFRAEYFVISGQGQLVPQPSFDISLVRPSSKWFELYFVEPAPLREASSSRGHPVGDSGHAYVKSLLLLSVQQAGVILNEGDIFWFPHNENYDTITAAVAKEKGFTAKCKLSHTYEDPVHGFRGVDSITLIVEPCPGGCKSPTGYVKELQRDEPRPLDLLKTPSGKDVMRECRAWQKKEFTFI